MAESPNLDEEDIGRKANCSTLSFWISHTEMLLMTIKRIFGYLIGNHSHWVCGIRRDSGFDRKAFVRRMNMLDFLTHGEVLLVLLNFMRLRRGSWFIKKQKVNAFLQNIRGEYIRPPFQDAGLNISLDGVLTDGVYGLCFSIKLRLYCDNQSAFALCC
ncbi:hypothetical protein Tco_0001947 [Tanacetum coccineum]